MSMKPRIWICRKAKHARRPPTRQDRPQRAAIPARSDLEEAAREGLLDEHTFVELKLALPPSGKNAETAKNLASFGVLGGVLIVKIRDEGGGKAGEVTGVNDASSASRTNSITGTW
jgi:hypothetical protein